LLEGAGGKSLDVAGTAAVRAAKDIGGLAVKKRLNEIERGLGDPDCVSAGVLGAGPALAGFTG